MLEDKIDDLKWHQDSENGGKLGGLHAAIYFVWLVRNGHIRSKYLYEWGLESKSMKTDLTPLKFFARYSDGKLLTRYMKSDALGFTKDYYNDKYLSQYTGNSLDLETDDSFKGQVYGIKDTWSNYQKVAAIIDEEYSIFNAHSIG